MIGPLPHPPQINSALRCDVFIPPSLFISAASTFSSASQLAQPKLMSLVRFWVK